MDCTCNSSIIFALVFLLLFSNSRVDLTQLLILLSLLSTFGGLNLTL